MFLYAAIEQLLDSLVHYETPKAEKQKRAMGVALSGAMVRTAATRRSPSHEGRSFALLFLFGPSLRFEE